MESIYSWFYLQQEAYSFVVAKPFQTVQQDPHKCWWINTFIDRQSKTAKDATQKRSTQAVGGFRFRKIMVVRRSIHPPPTAYRSAAKHCSAGRVLTDKSNVFDTSLFRNRPRNILNKGINYSILSIFCRGVHLAVQCPTILLSVPRPWCSKKEPMDNHSHALRDESWH